MESSEFKRHHFYVAFNPMFNEGSSVYKTQAHEFYHNLKQRSLEDPNAFMYWGKISVSEYSEPLDFEKYQKVVWSNSSLHLDTYLYITDYTNLWIGKVVAVKKDIPTLEDSLDFYKDKSVELWFKLTDFLLVSKDASKTIVRLQSLFVDSEYYNFKIKEINPYTASIRFPMIVQDHLERDFFGPPEHGKMIIKESVMLVESENEHRDRGLKSAFVISEENFSLLSDTVRSKIHLAELLLLEAHTPGMNKRRKLEESILCYLNALEIVLNETFIAHLRNVEGHRIYVNVEDKPKMMRSPPDSSKSMLIRLKDFKGQFSLSQIKMLLDNPNFFNHTVLDYVFRNKKLFWEYCRLELRPTFKNESLIEIFQNLSVGKELKVIDRELLLVRNILLGVGSPGIFNCIVEKFYEEFKKSTKTA